MKRFVVIAILAVAVSGLLWITAYAAGGYCNTCAQQSVCPTCTAPGMGPHSDNGIQRQQYLRRRTRRGYCTAVDHGSNAGLSATRDSYPRVGHSVGSRNTG